MSKSIKLENKVYYKLEEFRAKRETFSQAVEKLLDFRRSLSVAFDMVEGQKALREFQNAVGKEKPVPHE